VRLHRAPVLGRRPLFCRSCSTHGKRDFSADASSPIAVVQAITTGLGSVCGCFSSLCRGKPTTDERAPSPRSPRPWCYLQPRFSRKRHSPPRRTSELRLHLSHHRQRPLFQAPRIPARQLHQQRTRAPMSRRRRRSLLRPTLQPFIVSTSPRSLRTVFRNQRCTARAHMQGSHERLRPLRAQLLQSRRWRSHPIRLRGQYRQMRAERSLKGCPPSQQLRPEPMTILLPSLPEQYWRWL
jgi:hypothetical protein